MISIRNFFKSLLFFGVVMLIFTSCGKKETLESVLTDGSGKWHFIADGEEADITFFEDGKVNFSENDETQSGTYSITKDEKSFTLHFSLGIKSVSMVFEDIEVSSSKKVIGNFVYEGESYPATLQLIKGKYK